MRSPDGHIPTPKQTTVLNSRGEYPEVKKTPLTTQTTKTIQAPRNSRTGAKARQITCLVNLSEIDNLPHQSLHINWIVIAGEPNATKKRVPRRSAKLLTGKVLAQFSGRRSRGQAATILLGKPSRPNARRWFATRCLETCCVNRRGAGRGPSLRGGQPHDGQRPVAARSAIREPVARTPRIRGPSALVRGADYPAGVAPRASLAQEAARVAVATLRLPPLLEARTSCMRARSTIEAMSSPSETSTIPRLIVKWTG